MTEIYDILRRRFVALCEAHGLTDERGNGEIRVKALNAQQAIGDPEADDFPLQKGKERLMHAELGSGKGQAFTDQYGDFTGRLYDVLEMPLTNNYRRAVFVAALNAGLNYMGEASATVHCRDREPALCSEETAQYIREHYGRVRIAQFGFQPRLVETLQKEYEHRVVDLDPDNIGTVRGKVLIEGPESTAEAIDWADLLLVTGTTLVNDTIDQFLGSKPVLFFGTTIAGAAHLMNWARICPLSK